jgi:hypothetical protein
VEDELLDPGAATKGTSYPLTRKAPSGEDIGDAGVFTPLATDLHLGGYDTFPETGRDELISTQYRIMNTVAQAHSNNRIYPLFTGVRGYIRLLQYT